MPLRAAQRLRKQPWENPIYRADFEAALAKISSGVTLSSITSVAAEVLEGEGGSGSDLTFSGATIISGKFVDVQIAGGVSGVLYKVEFRCITSQGRQIERDGELLVED